MAAKTLEAYARDVSQFGQFLKEHLGQPATVSDLASLTVSDFRSFMAKRRKTGVESRTLARQLSAPGSARRGAAWRRQFRHLHLGDRARVGSC